MFVDKPIEKQDQDFLGTKPFAIKLAGQILDYKPKDSLVIGLYGGWGSGKTSIINMALEEIEKLMGEKDNKPIIVRFNPWYFTDQDQLILQFFGNLSSALNRQDNSQTAKKVGGKLKTYAKFFTPLKLIPMASPYVEIFSTVLEKVGDAANTWGEFKETDLDGIRKEIDALLVEEKSKIIIIIDDIDRLSDREIRQVFQLVKCNANFPNTIYFLSFEEKSVTDALDGLQNDRGNEYLEKIIQVPYRVPMFSEYRVRDMLLESLNIIIDNLPEDRVNMTHIGNLFHDGLKYFFKSPRDVIRYMNVLVFEYPQIESDVEPGDFIGITAIKVFLPNLYIAVRDNKKIFTEEINQYNSTDIEKDKAIRKEIIDRWVEESKDIIEEGQLIRFLVRLFPQLEQIYKTYGSQFLGQSRKICRVCHSEMFDSYFLLSLPHGEISRALIDEILAESANSGRFSKGILSLPDDNSKTRFIRRLSDFIGDIEKENIPEVIKSLIDIGDLLPETTLGDYFPLDWQVRSIIIELLKIYEDKEERYKIIKEAIESAEKSIFSILGLINRLGGEHGKYNEKEQPEALRILTIEQCEGLEAIGKTVLQKWAKDGKLNDHPNLLRILYFWDALGGEKETKEIVDDIILSDEGLLSFLTYLPHNQKPRSITDYIASDKWVIQKEAVDRYLDVDSVEPQLRVIYETRFDDLTEKQQFALKLFIEYIDRDQENLPMVERP